MITRLIGGAGNQMRIPMMLNNRWQSAIWMLFAFMTASAANIEVKVVPMFAPSVIGSILATGSTPMPTNGVKAEVVTELDCTIKVKATPNSIAK
mmetsp:Transcript_42066/g.100261  ORF Transcript_42066/g.100261 Transcript_42066/m.100261 type:complete len:94 (+) Transcript_42066:224-505(+)